MKKQQKTTQDQQKTKKQEEKNIETSTIIEILKTELKDTKQKVESLTNISQRAIADLQNYKRRHEEEKTAFIKFANQALFTDLLPAIENIKRTLNYDTKNPEWINGATATMEQIEKICEKHGLKTTPAQIGEIFNPEIHEVLLTGPGEKDKITEVLENGYMLGDKVLKLARIKVGNGE